MRECKCGCKMSVPSTRVFVAGHDLRAALRVIDEHYGSIEAFVDEWDAVDEINANLARHKAQRA